MSTFRALAGPVGAVTGLGAHFYNSKYHPDKLEKLQTPLLELVEQHNATAILDTIEAPKPSLIPYDLENADYSGLLTYLESKPQPFIEIKCFTDTS